jgi:hypothetical protein
MKAGDFWMYRALKADDRVIFAGVEGTVKHRGDRPRS